MPAACLLEGLDTSGAQEAAVRHDATSPLQRGDPDTLLSLLGATIRQSRQQQGLTQKVLAARTGLNPTYIGQIEQGQRNLSVLSLVQIAEALGLVVAPLLTPLETCQCRPSPLPIP